MFSPSNSQAQFKNRLTIIVISEKSHIFNAQFELKWCFHETLVHDRALYRRWILSNLPIWPKNLVRHFLHLNLLYNFLKNWKVQIITSFRTPTHFIFLNEKLNFCIHIAESANRARNFRRYWASPCSWQKLLRNSIKDYP